MQIKTTLRFHLTSVRMAKMKIKVTADAGKDVEKEEHSSIVGGIASLYYHSGNRLAVPQKILHSTTGRSRKTSAEHIYRRCSKQ